MRPLARQGLRLLEERRRIRLGLPNGSRAGVPKPSQRNGRTYGRTETSGCPPRKTDRHLTHAKKPVEKSKLEPEMTRTADEQLILDELKRQNQPSDMFSILHAVEPPPDTTDGRRREVKAHHVRFVQLVRVFLGLWEQGTIIETYSDEAGHLYELAPTVECPQCHQAAGRPHTDYCPLALREDVFAGVCSSPRTNHGDGRGCQDETCPRHGEPTIDDVPTEMQCRPVMVDGEPVHLIASADLSPEAADAITAVVRAARDRMAAEGIGQTSQPATRTSTPHTELRSDRPNTHWPGATQDWPAHDTSHCSTDLCGSDTTR